MRAKGDCLVVSMLVLLLILASGRELLAQSSAEVLKQHLAKLATVKDMWLKGEVQDARKNKFQAELWLKGPDKLRLKLTGPSLGKDVEELFVMDGTNLWAHIKVPNAPLVYKMDQKVFLAGKPGGLNSLLQVDRTKAIKTLREECNIAIGFSVRIAGKTMAVLNARTKDTVKYDPKDLMQASLPPVKTVKLYIDKEGWMLYRVDLYPEKSRLPMLSVSIKELKTNTNLKDDLFKFTPPADTQVLDLTELFKLMGKKP